MYGFYEFMYQFLLSLLLFSADSLGTWCFNSVISATEDDDLWGIQNGSMFCHYSFVLYSSVNNKKQPPARMISEDDWEDIMAEDLDEDL